MPRWNGARKLSTGRKMGRRDAAVGEKIQAIERTAATAERGGRGRERTLLSISSSRVIRQTRVPPRRRRRVASKLTAVYPAAAASIMAVTRTMQSDWRICSQMHRFRSSCSSSSNVALALLHSSRRGSKRAAGCSRFRRPQFCLSGSSLVSSWLIKREERHGRSLFSSLLILLRRNDGNRRASTYFTSWLSPTNILVANKQVCVTNCSAGDRIERWNSRRVFSHPYSVQTSNKPNNLFNCTLRINFSTLRCNLFARR